MFIKANLLLIREIILNNSDLIQTRRGEVISLRPSKVISYMNERRYIALKKVNEKSYLQCDPRFHDISVEFDSGEIQNINCTQGEWLPLNSVKAIKTLIAQINSQKIKYYKDSKNSTYTDEFGEIVTFYSFKKRFKRSWWS